MIVGLIERIRRFRRWWSAPDDGRLYEQEGDDWLTPSDFKGGS